MNWDKIAAREATPPFIPRLKDPCDTQYFASYPDEAEVDKKMRDRAGTVDTEPREGDEERVFDGF